MCALSQCILSQCAPHPNVYYPNVYFNPMSIISMEQYPNWRLTQCAHYPNVYFLKKWSCLYFAKNAPGGESVPKYKVFDIFSCHKVDSSGMTPG